LSDNYEFGDLDLPVNVGIGGTIIDLLFSVIDRKNAQTEFERNFQYHCLIGFEDKSEKWKKILENDLITKEKCSHSEVNSILSSTFVQKYFNRYLKEIYLLYFTMGYSKHSSKENQVIEELKTPIDKTCSELLTLIRNNVNDHLFRTIYGPIFKSFINDAYNDGVGYAAINALDSLRSSK
jgi:hypothetical protein